MPGPKVKLYLQYRYQDQKPMDLLLRRQAKVDTSKNWIKSSPKELKDKMYRNFYTGTTGKSSMRFPWLSYRRQHGALFR
jgi:hypothetical protein